MSNKHPPQQTVSSSEAGAPEATILRVTSKATTPPLRGTPPYQEGSRKNSPPEKGEYPEGGRGLIPKLRFPEFRDAGAWEEHKLSAISPAIFDGTHQTPRYVEAGIPFFSVENIVSGNKNKFISEADHAEATKKNKPEKGDILITRIGKIGFSAIVSWDYEFSIYVTLAVIKKADNFDSNFLHFCFQSDLYQSEILSKSLLNAVPCKINMEELRQTKVFLPAEKKEQKKIADCLSSLDTLIAAQAEKIDALKTHKKGLMQQLFPQDGETVPRLRFPEFREAGEWELKPFDKFVVKSFYGTSSSTSESGQYPVLRMGNMSEGRINFSNLVYIDLDPEAFEKIKLVRGDILLNRTNSLDLVGKISLFDQDFECITASYIVTYRLDGEQIDSVFCNFMLNTQLNQAKIKALARPSVSQANINPTAFRNELSVAVPEITEQQKIADCLSSLDALITAQAEKIDALKTHKKGLMQQLFPTVENEAGS